MLESMASSATKPIILQAPGTRVEGSLCYDANSLLVDMVENTRALGRFSISPSSLVFGQTATISIGNSDQFSTLYLTMRITIPANTPNVYAGSGWGYQAINSFNYLFGPSSLGPHNISGYGMLLANLVTAETGPKRQAIIDLGGSPINGPGTYDATIVIPLVMSNTYHDPHKLPIDLVGLNSPLVINIVFGRNTDFLSGLSASVIGGFSQAWMTAESFYLTDRNKSPALESKMSSGLRCSYPFYYTQSGTIPSFVSNGPAQETNLVLTNLINSDPMAIVFCVYRQSSVVQNALTSAPLSAGAMLTPDSVRFLINGEVWNLTQTSSLAFMDELVTSGSDLRLTAGQMAPAGQTLFPFTRQWTRGSFYVIQLSQQRCVAQTGAMANTRRTPQATPQLMLTFNTDPGEALVLHYIYIYQSLLAMSEGNSVVYVG